MQQGSRSSAAATRPGTFWAKWCQAPLLVLAALVLGACGDGRDEVTISAASSLTEVAEALEIELERQHPNIDIQLNLGGTSGLVSQIRSGAPVDLLLAADHLALAADDPLALETAPLATNELVIVTPPDRSLSRNDLSDEALRIVACDPNVPCGRLAEQLLADLAAASLIVEPDSLEPNVRLVRQRVLSGEADVGFVYLTDAVGGELRILDLDTTYRNTVTAVRVTDSDATQAIMTTILDGTTVLEIATTLGFGTP